jgi:hypothetical protein
MCWNTTYTVDLQFVDDVAAFVSKLEVAVVARSRWCYVLSSSGHW